VIAGRTDDKTMYVMAGLQTLAFLSNMSLRPVAEHLHEDDDSTTEK